MENNSGGWGGNNHGRTRGLVLKLKGHRYKGQEFKGPQNLRSPKGKQRPIEKEVVDQRQFLKEVVDQRHLMKKVVVGLGV